MLVWDEIHGSVNGMLAKEQFIQQFSGEHIKKQDKFGRTALHYAAIDNSRLKEVLISMKADNTIKDNYQKTSKDYEKMQENYSQQMSLLQLDKSTSFLTKYCGDITACIHNCFAKCSHSVKKCKTQLHEIVQHLPGFCDRESYVQNLWHECQYDYSKDMHRKTVALEQGDDRPSYKPEDFGNGSNENATKTKNMFETIKNHINSAMEELAKAITEQDHKRFACEVFPVGSAHEGTKIGCCDEFDYNFVLTNLSSICKVCHSPESPPGFVMLKASSPVNEDLKDLFDQHGILNTRLVKFKFETLVKQILSSASFCELTDMEFIDRVSTDDLGLTAGNVSSKLNTVIKLTFTNHWTTVMCHIQYQLT